MVLDDYKAIEAHSPEIEEEIKALGVLLFSGMFQRESQFLFTNSYISAGYDTVSCCLLLLPQRS